MITPDAPERQYSTRRRTAVVLTGSGTAGAYHAGVLRAFHEAGLKIDLVAGRGAGVLGAYFAALDGGARLWEPNGLWRTSRASRFYRWRLPLRVAGWIAIAGALILAVPLVLLGLAVIVAAVGLLLTLVGLERFATAVTTGYSAWIAQLFAPESLPTVIPRLVLLMVLLAVAALAVAVGVDALVGRAKRRTRHGLAWKLIGSPLTAGGVVGASAAELWHLIRGAAPLAVPKPVDLARKYVELLAENLGQPGFRELLVVVHDIDARRDLVFSMLAPAHRLRFFGRAGTPDAAGRHGEAFDLAGVARDHAVDALAAALSLPVATEPHLATFSIEGPWRGETHRLCDRPGALGRVLEEVARAGAEQVIVVTPAAPSGRAHELSAGRADLRGRAGEQLAAFEAADVRDVLEQFAGRFAGFFVVRPAYNPLGPLDFTGVHDERSDRRYTLAELMDRGYDDAHRQFVEPILGAGSDRVDRAEGGPAASAQLPDFGGADLQVGGPRPGSIERS